MKRTTAILGSFILMVGLLAACGGNGDAKPSATPAQTQAASKEPATQTDGGETNGQYEDGVYYAEEADFAGSGWKYFVALKVENGAITSVNWNGLNKDGGIDKKAVSAAGLYGMVEKGNAIAEWDVQAAAAEKFLVEKQDPAALAVDAEKGTTDAISGVTVKVNALADLATQALKNGPVAAGPYKDGFYKAEAADFAEKSGWKENVQLTVVNGNIIAVRWNATHKDGGTDKFTRSVDGEYGMNWHDQAVAAEKYLLEKQDPAAIVFNQEDGKTDAISGVSISVNGFVELAAKALADAK